MLRKFALWLCLIGTTLSAFAGDVLRYETPSEVLVGPFGQTSWRGVWTPERDLAETLRVLISPKAGALMPRFSTDKITHRGDGFYSVPLDWLDTGQYGTLEIVVLWAGQPLTKTCRVINRLTWDEEYTPVKVRAAAADVTHWNGTIVTQVAGAGGTVYPTVNIEALGGSTTASDNQEDAYDGTGYNFPNTTIPTVTITNSLGANAVNSATLDTSAVNEIVDQNWDEAASGHTAPGSFGSNNASTVTVSTINTGVITAASIATGAIGELELHASAVDEIVVDVKTELDTHGAGSWVDTGGGDATEAKQDAILAYIDTEVAAILVDTDATIPATITTIDTEVGQIKAVTDNLPDSGALSTIGTDTARLTAARAGALTDWIDGGRLDLLLDAVYTGTPPTVVQIRSEMDSNSTDLNTLITGVNLTKIEGHALAGTGTYIADSFEHFFNQATRQYNVNTPLSSFKADVSNLDAAISTVATPAQVATALSDINLDHLASTAAGIPAVPAGTWIDTIIDDTNELQTDDVPGLLSTIRGIDSDTLETLSDQIDAVYTGTPPTVVQIRQEMDSNSTDLNDILTDTAVIGALGAGLTGVPWNSAWDVQIESEAYDALVSIHLDHLLAADTGGSLPGVGGSILQDLLEDDGGTWRYTANALEEAPSGGDATAANQSTIISALTTIDNYVDSEVQAILDDTNELQTDDVPGLIGALNDVSTAQVNTQVDNAIVTYHLDHLLHTNYDPASKPGSATALLNELVENDGGVSRYTSNALEQAPGGGSSANLLLSTTVNVPDSQTQVTLNAGSDQDDAYSGAIVILTDASNSSYPSIRTVTDYVGATNTLVIDAAPGFTSDMISGDGVKIFIAERTLDQAAAVDGKTMRQALRYFGAILAGETSGAGTGTEVFKGLDGLTDRVEVIIGVNGNRKIINYDP